MKKGVMYCWKTLETGHSGNLSDESPLVTVLYKQPLMWYDGWEVIYLVELTKTQLAMIIQTLENFEGVLKPSGICHSCSLQTFMNKG